MPDRPLKPLESRERLSTRIWGIAFAVLYWMTRTASHTMDALSYSRLVRDGGIADLFHPHHLLYNLGIWTLWKALTGVHPSLDPFSVAAVVNSALGGLLLTVFARTLLENGTTYFWTSFATLGLGLSQCMWTLASENEVYVATTLFLTLSARHALRASRSAGGHDSLRSGLWVAAAALVHIVALLFLAPALILAGWGASSRAAAWKRRLVTAAAALLPVLACYATAIVVRHANTPERVAGWVNRYMRWESWTERNPVRVGLGFLWFLRGALPDFGLIGRAPSPTAIPWLNDLVRLPFLLFGAAAGYLLYDGWRKRAYLAWRFGALPVLCLAWFLCFELFLGWVGRSSLKFWTLTLPPLWAFSAMWADLRFGDPEAEGLRRMSHRSVLAVLSILALQIATTGFLVVAPRHDPLRDRPRSWSDNVARLTGPNDFILVPEGELEGYLLYYGRRPNLLTLENDARHTGSFQESMDTLFARATRARARGGRAWMLGTGLVVTPDAAAMWRRRHVPDDVYRLVAARLRDRGPYDSTLPIAPGDSPLGYPRMLEFMPDSVLASPAPNSGAPDSVPASPAKTTPAAAAPRR